METSSQSLKCHCSADVRSFAEKHGGLLVAGAMKLETWPWIIHHVVNMKTAIVSSKSGKHYIASPGSTSGDMIFGD